VCYRHHHLKVPLGHLATLAFRCSYASEHVKQRTLGQEPTGRRLILTSNCLSPPLTTKATDSRTHAELSVGLLSAGLLDAAPGAQKAPEVKVNETSGQQTIQASGKLPLKRQQLGIAPLDSRFKERRCPTQPYRSQPVLRSNHGRPSPAQPWTYAPPPEQVIRDPIRCYRHIVMAPSTECRYTCVNRERRNRD
jgi:hypothetical protein